MSYTPTEWQTGDTITAAGLNKMERGIAGAVASFSIEFFRDPEEGISRIILFASPAELQAAYQAGAVIIASGALTDLGVAEMCVLYFSYASEDFSSANFYGHDPNAGGIDGISFYPDASGNTMSTDGGYVP